MQQVKEEIKDEIVGTKEDCKGTVKRKRIADKRGNYNRTNRKMLLIRKK